MARHVARARHDATGTWAARNCSGGTGPVTFSVAMLLRGRRRGKNGQRMGFLRNGRELFLGAAAVALACGLVAAWLLMSRSSAPGAAARRPRRRPGGGHRPRRRSEAGSEAAAAVLCRRPVRGRVAARGLRPAQWRRHRRPRRRPGSVGRARRVQWRGRDHPLPPEPARSRNRSPSAGSAANASNATLAPGESAAEPAGATGPAAGARRPPRRASAPASSPSMAHAVRRPARPSTGAGAVRPFGCRTERSKSRPTTTISRT